jgi:hypothetical protein
VAEAAAFAEAPRERKARLRSPDRARPLHRRRSLVEVPSADTRMAASDAVLRLIKARVFIDKE